MFSALTSSLQTKPSIDEIKTNILAGITVGVIALMVTMGLAISSGVPPQHGLYTAIISGIVVALAGGSKVNISGPTATFVVVLFPIVQQFGLGGLLMSGLMAGFILIIMGMSKLGRLIEVMPYPVIVGLTAGIGIVLAVMQIEDFLGLTIHEDSSDFLQKMSLIYTSLPTFDWQESAIGLLTLFVLLVWPRLVSKTPVHLVALVIASLSAYVLSFFFPEFSVDTIGSRFEYEIDGTLFSGIPAVTPEFNWPWNLPGVDGEPIGFSFELLRALFPAAITIAVLGALSALLSAVVADGLSGKKHNPDDELIGQGLGNIAAPLFGGIPSSSAIARTIANVKLGASLPLAGIVHSVFILLSILLLAPLLSYIPMAAIAALLLMVAWNMTEARHLMRTLRVAPRDDAIVLLLCILLTVLFDITVAVAIAVGLAGMLFIKESAGLTEIKLIDQDHKDYDLPDNTALYIINGPLFFGSAEKALRTKLSVQTSVKNVVLDMNNVPLLDMSAIVAMEAISKEFDERHIGLIITNLRPNLILKLRRVGVRTQAGKISYARSVEEAIDKIRLHEKSTS